MACARAPALGKRRAHVQVYLRIALVMQASPILGANAVNSCGFASNRNLTAFYFFGDLSKSFYYISE
jgi:hypothetical protein